MALKTHHLISLATKPGVPAIKRNRYRASRAASRSNGNDTKLLNGHSSTVAPVLGSKRKDVADSDTEERSSKRLAVGAQRPIKAAVSKQSKAATAKAQQSRDLGTPLNQAPTQVLTIFPVGSGECGELGLGPAKTSLRRPGLNPYLDPSSSSSEFHIVQLFCAGMHTIALTADNKIVTWGVNDNYALGRSTEWDEVMRDADVESGDEEAGELNPYESTPTAIPASSFPADTRFVQIAAGDSCSFALTDAGLVYGWGTFRDDSGNNQFGYDADGSLVECQKTPIQIQSIKDVTQITCGANHVLALDAKGTIWGWGAHEQNQLGRRLFGRHTEHLSPRRVEICRDKITYIASGEYHSFAVDEKDNVWAWGLNSYGEAGYVKGAGDDSSLLPYPMKIPALCGRGIKVIDGGAHHSAAISQTGEFLVWGRMDGGQLGIEFTAEQLADEGLIRHDERKKPRICLLPTLVPHIGDAVHVGCGSDHTIFINKEGRAYATGIGSSNQLGLGSDDDVEVAGEVKSKDLKERVLTWAGAGGQYSIVAGVHVAQG